MGKVSIRASGEVFVTTYHLALTPQQKQEAFQSARAEASL